METHTIIHLCTHTGRNCVDFTSYVGRSYKYSESPFPTNLLNECLIIYVLFSFFDLDGKAEYLLHKITFIGVALWVRGQDADHEPQRPRFGGGDLFRIAIALVSCHLSTVGNNVINMLKNTKLYLFFQIIL